MSLKLPQLCPRSLTVCQPLAQILCEDDFTFICCGHSDASTRSEPQDRFRVCFRNKAIDQMTDWDERDIIDHISVLAQALSVDTNIRNNEESVDETQVLPGCDDDSFEVTAP